MPAQSSGVMIIRAVVMMVFLAVILLAAIFGSALPKVLSDLMEGRLPQSIGQQSASTDEASRCGALPPPGAMPAGPAEPMAPGWQPEPIRDPLQWPAGALDPSPSRITPAAYEASVQPGADVVPPPADGRDLAAAAASLPDRGAQESAGGGQFSSIQERLRQLGASYYLLETWGNEQQRYRFYCEMAIGGNPSLTRHFEATHADPLQAMAQVLQEVEAWRAGRP